jgi:glutamate synthase (NADPH) large chain
MVEFDPLEADDVETLRELVGRHHEYTRSGVAERLLARWTDTVKHFVKVMPTEYRSVLAKAHLDTEAARLAAV